jgi:hypothetical protein
MIPTYKHSVAEIVTAWVPDSDAHLRAAIQRRCAHVLADTRGLEEWMQLVQFREPKLKAIITDRGADRLVAVGIDTPKLSGLAHVSGGLDRAREILLTLIAWEWGTAPHRYHWRHETARRRFAREWGALERVFRRAIADVWCEMACDALGWALQAEAWEIIYHWAQCRSRYPVIGLPDDAVPTGIAVLGPYREARPITPAAHARAERQREALADALARVRPALLALTPDDIRAYARDEYGAGERYPWIAVNRPSYLLGIAAHAWARRYQPPPDEYRRDALWMASLGLPARVIGLDAALELDPAIVAHADRLHDALRDALETR